MEITMFQLRTVNPLYSSKQYFYEKEDAYVYLHKIIKMSLDFFRKMDKEERRKYQYDDLKDLEKLITLAYFDHTRPKVKKCFEKAVEPTSPITYEEYMAKWQKENKKRHNAIGQRKEG